MRQTQFFGAPPGFFAPTDWMAPRRSNRNRRQTYRAFAQWFATLAYRRSVLIGIVLAASNSLVDCCLSPSTFSVLIETVMRSAGAEAAADPHDRRRVLGLGGCEGETAKTPYEDDHGEQHVAVGLLAGEDGRCTP